MILNANLPRLIEIARGAERVLDVGGWYRPLRLATHAMDLQPYATRRLEEALDPGEPERVTAETWTVHDACLAPWPYPDKYFDFVFCSHLLEDVRDPLLVCREMSRVARAGYVETPSRLREIYCKQRGFRLRRAFGGMPEIGFHHHRWFVEPGWLGPEGGARLLFTAKTAALYLGPAMYLTRSEVGRKLTEVESGLGLFWEGGIEAEERFVDLPDDYRGFKRLALAGLRR
jgi:SAM-dependent methyltransferase